MAPVLVQADKLLMVTVTAEPLLLVTVMQPTGWPYRPGRNSPGRVVVMTTVALVVVGVQLNKHSPGNWFRGCALSGKQDRQA